MPRCAFPESRVRSRTVYCRLSVVQNWCPKCDNNPHDLDSPRARRRSHEKTDFLITCFDPGILWDDFGIRADVVPFTHGFPHADTHELLSPDLLHQVIKGTFKDHLVEWGITRALEIIADIDHRISAVYIAAITDHVPSQMVKCIAAFMDFCYLARRNSLNSDALDDLKEALNRFHLHRDIFIQTGVCVDISLPRQHSLVHYLPSIRLFGSPNGLCSSITESKHIKAVKEPWHRSSRYNALIQMLRTICRLDRLAAARIVFCRQGMMAGTSLSYAAMTMRGEEPQPPLDTEDEDEDDDGGDLPRPRSLSSIELAATHARGYPCRLEALATYIHQPNLPDLLRRFLYDQLHPDSDTPSANIPIDHCPNFLGRIYVHHSAVARFYAPSDLCGVGGMYREHIRSNPNWHGSYARHDTVFIQTNAQERGMEGMAIGRVLLFFSFTQGLKTSSCALVHWFSVHGDTPDPDTGMWVVTPDTLDDGTKSLAVIDLDCIARAAHLLPVYGSAILPEDFHFSFSLDVFRAFFVNRYADHHTHEFI
ncbi:hypothetical protein B0H17DRAFT_1069971 [Mycena rosella]|uniref:Uncharacterized protein n=1 Tax=Mycena rosella TaxID=1033263 RepID=A0AAD7DBJ2_MYCRO|nr:hypothetical protein B0H17DRAFT_1069971 [Mycena rosella]